MAHNLLGKTSIPLLSFGGLTTLMKPQGVPAGASPLCHDVVFRVSSVATRPGLRSQFSFAGFSTTRGGSLATSNGWSNPSAVLASDAYSSCGQVNGTSLVESGYTIDVTGFGFNLSAQQSVQGVQVGLTGYADAPVTVTAQLVVGGVAVGNVETVLLTATEATAVTLGGAMNLFGAAIASVNGVDFGVRLGASSTFALASVYLNDVQLTVSTAAGAANFNYVKSFEDMQGNQKTFALDAEGTWWIEDVTQAPKVLNVLLQGVTPGSFAKSATLDDREYVCFTDLQTGTDIVRQYTTEWIDKVTQDGPGAAPVFSAVQVSGQTYDIASITQPAAQSRGYSYFLQSTGPGSTSAGNVCTVYYSDSTAAGADADLVNAFNSGQPVYLYVSFTGGSQTQGPYTVQVTSVGEGSPPGQPRQFFYFTYAVATSVYTFYAGSGHAGYVAHYQRSLATVTLTVPAPNLAVNGKATIAGSSVAFYDATWTVTQTVDSGNFSISQTQMDANGNATYNYTLISGVAPAVGQSITVINTLNGNGLFNVNAATVTASSGGPSGTFTVGGFPAAAIASLSEGGLANTSGLVFTFDPGAVDAGTPSDPIGGNASGGTLTEIGSAQQSMSAGTRQGVMFFITRNEQFTFPSPPVTFTTPENTTAIKVSSCLIGPPDVVARGFAITEAGQNGVPGANFFYIATAVSNTTNGVTVISDALRIDDNTASSATFYFTDATLLKAQAIDIQGSNLFEQIGMDGAGWCVPYASRMFYGLTLNRVPNLVNVGFDGGYLGVFGGVNLPAGWTATTGGKLLQSPVFGNSYYIQNATASVQATYGMLSQTAYQDVYKAPVIRPNTAYSVRVAARIPSGVPVGSLVVDLVSGGKTFGSFTLPFASMTQWVATYTGTLLTQKLATVPEGLTLRVYAAGMGAGADVELDRMEVFPTQQPVRKTAVLGSYVDNFEALDQDSGVLDTAAENEQSCNGAGVMNDVLYLLKDASLYYTQDSPSEEPGSWAVHEVSNRVGACGIHAYDAGEQWIVMACRNGLYLFTGGELRRLTKEIGLLWNAINWAAARTIVVRNDGTQRRLYVSVPMATPNEWLPDAPVNANPTTPNVMLVCDYATLDGGSDLEQSDTVKVTYAGTLEAPDMQRKWTIWQIACPYLDLVKRGVEVDQEMLLCNGVRSSKIYTLDGLTDDGATIDARYCTFGFNDPQNQTMGLHRKRFSLAQASVSGTGRVQVSAYANQLTGTPWTLPGGIALGPPGPDTRFALNVGGDRVFMDFQTKDVVSSMLLEGLVMVGAQDPWSPI